MLTLQSSQISYDCFMFTYFYLAFGEIFLIFAISAAVSNAMTSTPKLFANLRCDATLMELPKKMSSGGIPSFDSCSISFLFWQLNFAPKPANVLRTIALLLHPASKQIKQKSFLYCVTETNFLT